MKKTTFFSAIIVIVITLGSCNKTGMVNPSQNCGSGTYWDPNYQNVDGSYGACVSSSAYTTTTTGGGTTTNGQTTASQNTTITACQAYPDLNGDGWVDQPGANTLAGGNPLLMDMSYRAVRMGDIGFSGYGSGDYALISLSNLNLIKANLFWNAVSNIFTPNVGAGTVVFQWTSNNGVEYGSLSYVPVYQNGALLIGNQNAGGKIMYYVTGYQIVQ